MRDVNSKNAMEQNSSQNTSRAGEPKQTEQLPKEHSHSSESSSHEVTENNVRIVTPKSFSFTRNSTLQPLMIRSSIQSQGTFQSPVTSQPWSSRPSALPSPFSMITSTQPPTLFILALAKLTEANISLAVIKKLMSKPLGKESGELSPPDSLTSAPPSYSFVLRQMAARRRPRLMGTFIPSPSFVQHTPPPNYATAFDIYVDNTVPPPPRVYHFGFASMPAVCHECGYTGMTVVTSKITVCTHMCAFLLCLFCCWICVPLPYILRSCKDVYHHCRACRSYLGMYCPTNPDNTTNYS